MIREHDRVVLAADLPDAALLVGDVGTVVHVYADGAAYEVEFVTLAADQVRPIRPRELPHARPLVA